MTEKRFRVEKQTFDGYCIVDTHFDGYYAYEKQDLEKLCENLNDLSEENEKLKKIFGFLRNDNATDILNVLNSQENQICELKKENEQLKNQNKLLSDELEQCKAVIDYRWSEYLKKKEEQEND